ncbi:MAG TPA: cobamide remodeling phosphodiesterase CbiR [Anaerolineae bacterium]|nr:cobamide remodeling phosphodiesterase CbiR [Anaerolineae bacterium]
MRFGIMTMQRGALIPSGMSMEAALVYIASLDHADLARDLSSHGFDPIELGGDMALFFPQSLAPPTIERLAALKAETGLTYTVHLPLWSVEPSTPLTPVRKGSVQALVDTVQATKNLEPECYVLHATGALAAEFYRMNVPEYAKAFLLQQFQGHARESIGTLLAESGLPSRQVAIETVEFPLELTLELAEDLDLSLCLDTGHVLSGFSGPVGLFDALERCLPRLVEIHLHDAPGLGSEGEIVYGQDHQPLGAGDLDVGRLLDRLAEARWGGPVIFELTLEEALTSMEVIRGVWAGVDDKGRVTRDR